MSNHAFHLTISIVQQWCEDKKEIYRSDPRIVIKLSSSHHILKGSAESITTDSDLLSTNGEKIIQNAYGEFAAVEEEKQSEDREID